jgi:hypothetical protein
MSKTASSPISERIANDSGGRIVTYLTKYEALCKSGQRVVIEGTCALACTLLLGVIPHNRICVTPRAEPAFHAAWDLSLTGADQYPGDQISMVALPGRRAPMNRAARRIAVGDYLSERA